MASLTRDLWFMTPLQVFAVISNAVNTGASGAQSPMAMPTLILPEVPPNVASTQLLSLLNVSEHFFPPLNAINMFANLIVGVAGFMYKDSNAAANAKYPWALAAFAMNAATTAYAVTIMVPKNNINKNLARTLQTNPTDEKSAKQLRAGVENWNQWNYGRAALMLAASVFGVIGALEDGSIAKIPAL